MQQEHHLHAKGGKAENDDQVCPERLQSNLLSFPSQKQLADHHYGPLAKLGCLRYPELGNLRVTSIIR